MCALKFFLSGDEEEGGENKEDSSSDSEVKGNNLQLDNLLGTSMTNPSMFCLLHIRIVHVCICSLIAFTNFLISVILTDCIGRGPCPEKLHNF